MTTLTCRFIRLGDSLLKAAPVIICRAGAQLQRYLYPVCLFLKHFISHIINFKAWCFKAYYYGFRTVFSGRFDGRY